VDAHVAQQSLFVLAWLAYGTGFAYTQLRHVGQQGFDGMVVVQRTAVKLWFNAPQLNR